MTCRMEQGGKFVYIKSSGNQEIVVRFPPEASGFLHIGHAKAALLNQYYQKQFNGKLIMRFDDTNPNKEKSEYEKAILQDLKTLKVEWDIHTYTSDSFEKILDFANIMIKNDLAYVDDRCVEIIRSEREKMIEPICRNNTTSENLKKWQEMIDGTTYGKQCCLRAKIDYASFNGCMRDPVIYRCCETQHPRTKDKYKVYPTYDFACPIVDSIENVSHAMRTSEYADRDHQYYWFCDALKIRKPQVLSYSRLGLEYTLLSKRKLAYLVESKYVNGWDDPRFPTVRGMFRRGMTLEGLKEFVIAQGFSKSITNMSWDKIWGFNKKIIDVIVPRYTAIDQNCVIISLVNFKNCYNDKFEIDVDLHPKNSKIGSKKILCSDQVYINYKDAIELKLNSRVTLIKWTNIEILKIKQVDNKIVEIVANLLVEDKNFKNTNKLSWISANDQLVKIEATHYGNILTKCKLEKNDDFKKFINHKSMSKFFLLGESSMKIKAGDSIQIMRMGYYICDAVDADGTLNLIDIPDGRATNLSTCDSVSNVKNPNEIKKLVDAITNCLKDIQIAEAKGNEPILLKKQRKLIDLKKRFKGMAGEEFNPDSASVKTEKKSTKTKSKKNKKTDQSKKQEKTQDLKSAKPVEDSKKNTKLGMDVKKSENFNKWYTQVLQKAEMIEYYDVSGCYIITPWSFFIWEAIKEYLDKKIKSFGFSNAYFPMFVSEAALQKEETHIADFSPEVAWVTQSGNSVMAKKIAIRPTSETVMYPTFSKWVQSHRDLPIKINQWCNVVRWEFKDAMPFVRSREFLWQEGHSAYSDKNSAMNEVYEIIDQYEYIYESLLAIPVIKGKKTEKEKFAGGDMTTTVEVIVTHSGRGVQAATSHFLGQNFSKIFDISYIDTETNENSFAYQNSWAITTRSIGLITMIHGDDKGMILPPKVAKYQVVIIPCGLKASLPEKESQEVIQCCESVKSILEDKNVRVHVDNRDNYSPGWKFNYWELKGVPLRCEIGPRDVKSKSLTFVRRDTCERVKMGFDNMMYANVVNLFNLIHDNLLTRATERQQATLSTCTIFEESLQAIKQNKIIYAPFCLGQKCEEEFRKLTTIVESDKQLMGAKSLCIPFKKIAVVTSEKCINPNCTSTPTDYVYFGRSY
ncbi:hypothetical protein A3Q56_00355 [Intoshia linei]|uniref:Aminoacyl-transfer RNA synthetases class-II family profile domain-containing protein n=1 Tax=Intoshia linei TaxID=1819745 RepID=A0A177BC09_9BILA|nr:hypothetical protein A3Q56_00355 [Intoshia linei]